MKDLKGFFDVYKDSRGELVPIDAKVEIQPFNTEVTIAHTLAKQVNVTTSKPNTWRGFHIQPNEHRQHKKLFVLSGTIIDYFVDMRPGSPGLGSVRREILEKGDFLIVPDGFAHGFYSPKKSVVLYLSTAVYDPKNQVTLKWDFTKHDGIDLIRNAVKSEKDDNGLDWDDALQRVQDALAKE